jgi:hemerythrin superfamily protein
MSAVLEQSSHSSATDMIRADHSRVLAAFHRFDRSARPAVQRALVETICLSLEIHADIEENVLYPAAKDVHEPTVDKSLSDHAEMRRLISELRSFDPLDAQFEPAFMQLMALVIHHVADEETRILPAVDRLPQSTVRELSARIWKRRAQLMKQNWKAIASNKVRAAPAFAPILAVTGIGLLALFALTQRTKRH